MKTRIITTNIADLKSRLSHYLRMVKKGETVIIKDRAAPVAELTPLKKDASSPWDTLIREGKLIPATRSTENLKITPLSRSVSIQDILQQVRED